MPFHHEWSWYDINFPNPDGALCRLNMDEGEWRRMTRQRDCDWFKNGGNETNRILVHQRDRLKPFFGATVSDHHLLPAAGVKSEAHARRHPAFYYELFYRMLEERESLVRRGLLPPELPGPCYTHNSSNNARAGKRVMTAGHRMERDRKNCECVVENMVREGWFDGAYARSY